MSHIWRKSVFRVAKEVRHKLTCAANKCTVDICIGASQIFSCHSLYMTELYDGQAGEINNVSPEFLNDTFFAVMNQ